MQVLGVGEPGCSALWLPFFECFHLLFLRVGWAAHSWAGSSAVLSDRSTSSPDSGKIATGSGGSS